MLYSQADTKDEIRAALFCAAHNKEDLKIETEGVKIDVTEDLIDGIQDVTVICKKADITVHCVDKLEEANVQFIIEE